MLTGSRNHRFTDTCWSHATPPFAGQSSSKTLTNGQSQLVAKQGSIESYSELGKLIRFQETLQKS